MEHLLNRRAVDGGGSDDAPRYLCSLRLRRPNSVVVMDSPNATSPIISSFSGQSSRSRSSTTKLAEDIPQGLTSFNPFSEEDEHDQSSYTLVTSIFSRMKNTLSAPLSSAVAVSSSNPPTASNPSGTASGTSEARRPSYSTAQTGSSTFSTRTNASDRPNPLIAAPVLAAPPLVSLTPAQSELPTYTVDYERPDNRTPYSPVYSTRYSPGLDPSGDGPFQFGTSIPGFPIPDDARSIKTTASVHRSGSVSKVIRRLRGEGEKPHYIKVGCNIDDMHRFVAGLLDG